MKECPGDPGQVCGMMVPIDAQFCKHCMHDFSAKPKRSAGALGLLFGLAAMALIGFGTMKYVEGRNVTERIVIDEETRSVVFTTKGGSGGVNTDRVSFDQVAKVELVVGGSAATWEVALVTLDDNHRTISVSNDKPLTGYAEHVAGVMKKPLVKESKKRGFGGTTPFDDASGSQTP